MSNNNFLKVSTIGAMFRFNASVLLSPALSILKNQKEIQKQQKLLQQQARALMHHLI
jgi:hypothetical protein